MGVENSENAARSLKYIKEELQINPEIIVHDLSPNLIKATCDVFGYEKMAFDPFHVMQALNRAILKDLNAYRDQHFTNEKKQLLKLRNFVNSIQRDLKKEPQQIGHDLIDKIPEINPNNQSTLNSVALTSKILFLLSIEDKVAFFSELKSFLSSISTELDEALLNFVALMREKLPKREPTQKGVHRLKIELLKRLKKYFLFKRKPFEEKQREFNKNKYILFYSPENLDSARIKLLSDFLDKYPSLNKYRLLTLRVGSIYRLPLEKVNASIILDLEEDSNYGSELISCLKTFKKYNEVIIRFHYFFKAHPDMPKCSRANREFANHN